MFPLCFLSFFPIFLLWFSYTFPDLDDTVPIKFPDFVNPPKPYFPMAIQAFTAGILKKSAFHSKWNICVLK